MRVEATLYLSRQARARATFSANGGFSVTVRAFDRSAKTVEPWFLVFCGDAALAFWGEHQADMVAGAEVRIVASRVVCQQGQGNSRAEILATVSAMQVTHVPGQAQVINAGQMIYEKPACSAHAVCAGSYQRNNK